MSIKKKKCTVCGKTKSIDCFGTDKYKKDGKSCSCFECRNLKSRRTYNKEYDNLRKKKYNHKKRTGDTLAIYNKNEKTAVRFLFSRNIENLAPLSKQQSMIYDYIKNRYKSTGEFPTVAESAHFLNINYGSAKKSVGAISLKGYIIRINGDNDYCPFCGNKILRDYV